jgi:hypothetical protein
MRDKTAAERFRATYGARRANGGIAKGLPTSVSAVTRAELARRAKSLENLRPVRLIPLLPLGCNPQRAMTADTVHDVRRHMACKNYDACLDHADGKQWSGFHCDACPHNED